MKAGFDNEKYIRTQSEHIRERIDQFGGKLYLEFGGKLFDDYHASRVLPGFRPDSKINMLLQLKHELEAIIAVNAGDIEKNKIRGDLGITYDLEVLRLIDAFRDRGMEVSGVVLTQYAAQPAAVTFEKKLKTLQIKVYKHYPISGYPGSIESIVSEEGFGRNEYIETSKPLVVVTAPGPGSGKMATCLSQLYQDNKRGISAGYAKFETFPIWNLPLRHPVNMAYEAATIDLGDVNMIDPFHLENYNKTAINYNRDIEVFPVLKAMLDKILGESPYRSPTDMGVNMVGNCICDDIEVCRASRMEIIRRYYHTRVENKQGNVSDEILHKFNVLLNQAEISINERKVIGAVMERANELDTPVTGVELPDGRIITGKSSPLMISVSAMLLNAMKALADLDDRILLMSRNVIDPVQRMKTEGLGNKNPRLHADEMLIALSICAQNDDIAAKALGQLHKLKGCEVHCSVIQSAVDSGILKKLGMNVTCEPRFQTNCLFQSQRL